jgi:hypothetical protein
VTEILALFTSNPWPLVVLVLGLLALETIERIFWRGPR